jgi:hypothetical protein
MTRLTEEGADHPIDIGTQRPTVYSSWIYLRNVRE